MAQTIDTVMPDGAWEFDEGVTAAFDDMLARSIPQYEVMRQAVFSLGSRYIQPHTAVVDMGASRGEASAPLIDIFYSQNRFHLIEMSPPMLDVLRERFAHYITMASVRVTDLDLRYRFPPVEASLVLSILTLQFTPIEYRQAIVQRIYDALVPGGAFILVEKVLGQTARLDEKMTEIYYALKSENGYTAEQIERKRMSLEGVLVPVTAKWNEELLHMAGFHQIDCFWRWMTFAGWVAIK